MPKLLRTRLTPHISLNFLPEDVTIGREIERKNYETLETNIFCSLLKKGDCVVDIGANIGFYTLLSSDIVGEKGMVFAFDPDPTSFMLLIKNISHNRLSNIFPYLLAIGEKKERKKLYLSEKDFGDHRLYPEEESERKTITAIMTSLDLFITEKEIPKVTTIKIDTLGYEPYIIEGAKQCIEKDKPDLFMTYWPYGFGLSGGKGKSMMEFLEDVYHTIYLLDETNHVMQKATVPELDAFTKKYGGKQCTILLTTKELDGI